MRYSDHRVIVWPPVQFIDPIVTRDENEIIPFDARTLEVHGYRLAAIGGFYVEDCRFSAKPAGDYELGTLFPFAKQSGFEQLSQTASPTDQLDHWLTMELFTHAKALRKRSGLAFCHSPHAARVGRFYRCIVVILQTVAPI